MTANMWALLVGINQYAEGSGVTPLRGAVADVEVMHAFLTRQLGVPPDQTMSLTDREATRAGILEAWQMVLLANARPDAELLFYFSGHGSQAPSIDPAEPDGLDESLVAFDSRQPGSYDILDKELAFLIGQAEAAGAAVTVLLDCCHSGSGTRRDDQPRARLFKPLPAHAQRPKLLAEPAELVAAAHRSSSHILVAAAGDDQLANEYLPPASNRWRGAMTYFLLDALRTAGQQTTWAALHDQVVARVHTIYPQQTPQFEGDRSRTLAGSGITPAQGYLRVLNSPEPGLARIDGGEIVGIRLSATVAVFPPGSGMTGNAQVLGSVERVQPYEAWIRLEQVIPVAPGSRVRILSYGYQDQKHGVWTEDPGVLHALQQIGGSGGSPFLHIATDASTATFHVRRLTGKFIVESLSGERLTTVTDGDPHAVVARLEHLALYRNILALRNPAPAPLLRTALAISEPVVAGDTVRFTITNRSPQRLYVTVFRLGTDFGIKRIEPTRGTTVTLAPGSAGSLHVHDQPLWNNHGEATAPVIYKIFVLATRVDLDSLQLPPLGEDRQPDRPSTRADSPLAYLLDSICNTGTRPYLPASSTTEELWYTTDLEVL